MELTVAVGTFGDEWWRELAIARPIAKAHELGLPVVHVHGDTLHEARNAALDLVSTPWVVHVDADDELTPGFVAAMAGGTGDVRVPSVQYVEPTGGLTTPRMPRVAGHAHDCEADCLAYGNWIVVGAVVRSDLARQIGWRDYAWSEDWDFWLRCSLAGASIEAIPAAIYKAWVRRDSRNRGASHAVRLAAHRAIATANGVPVP